MYKMIEYKPEHAETWNKGKLIGQKPRLKPQHIWGIRIHLQMDNNRRDLALFNLAIDSKLRGCDLVRLRVNDISQSGAIQPRAQIVQQKTHRPVSFEITEQTKEAVNVWITEAELKPWDFLFPSADRTFAPSFYSPVRSACEAMGGEHWARSGNLRNALT